MRNSILAMPLLRGVFRSQRVRLRQPRIANTEWGSAMSNARGAVRAVPGPAALCHRCHGRGYTFAPPECRGAQRDRVPLSQSAISERSCYSLAAIDSRV